MVLCALKHILNLLAMKINVSHLRAVSKNLYVWNYLHAASCTLLFLSSTLFSNSVINFCRYCSCGWLTTQCEYLLRVQHVIERTKAYKSKLENHSITVLQHLDYFHHSKTFSKMFLTSILKYEICGQVSSSITSYCP